VITRCDRCRKRYRGCGDWNLVVRQGFIVGHLCPTCQTPEENAEAVINEATIDYGQSWLDGSGRWCAPCKAVWP
jgi:hypothetical protein